MKALITGASGFLGSHLVDACLSQGDDVRVLLRPGSDRAHLDALRQGAQVERVLGDLTNAASLAAAVRGVAVVYHAAARVADHGSRRQFYQANVEGTRDLLAAARAAGVARFVYVSSPSVVATGEDQVRIDESVPYPKRPLNLYCETKAQAERLVLTADAPGFTTCAIRPRGVWGPRDLRGAIAKLLAKMRAGKLPDLSGGRTLWASLCHCDNAAAACLLAARAAGVGGKAYFITDGEDVDTWAFVRGLAATFGVTPPTRRPNPRALNAAAALLDLVWRLPPLAHHRSPPLSRYSLSLLARTGTYDISAAVRDLGYRPVITHQQGMAALVRWVESIGGLSAFLREVSP